MRNTRVLVVEDEPGIRNMNAAYLEGEGYDVSTAASAEETRSILREIAPDIILLDVVLPDGSGFDLCNEIRGSTSAPIIYVSALEDAESIVKGLAIGGDDYITKPYDLDVLGARVAAIVRRAGNVMSGCIELSPLKVDLVSGVTTLNGEVITLSNKEMQLLAYLVSNAGRKIPDNELYEAIWGDMDLVSSQTLGVHISYLRNKLGLKEEDSPFKLLHIGGEYVFTKV
jgi:DNA-binding response OmpR family regulator